MKRYFELLNSETLEVYLGPLSPYRPAHSVLVAPEALLFIKPVFDQFPNPTRVLEGASLAETQQVLSQKINAAKADCYRRLSQTDWYVTRAFERQIPIPPEVSAERTAILQELEDQELLIQQGLLRNQDNL